MNQKIKKKWLEALRSGEYNQGKGFLRKNNKFCCLGVLCDLYVKIQYIEEDEIYSWNNEGILYREASYLPERVMDWAELETGNPFIDNVGNLTDINDEMELNFYEIANLIEGDITL